MNDEMENYMYWGDVHTRLVTELTPIVAEALKDDEKFKPKHQDSFPDKPLEFWKAKTIWIEYIADWTAPSNGDIIVERSESGACIKMGWRRLKELGRFFKSFDSDVIREILQTSATAEYPLYDIVGRHVHAGGLSTRLEVKTRRK